ncbi:hypothetical protein Golomagni_05342, partial [Golovinomyces magnicellulatus]
MKITVSTLANGSQAENPTQNHPIDVQCSPPQTLSRGLNEFLYQQAKTFQTRYSEAETFFGIFNQLLDNLTDPQMRQLAESMAIVTRDKILLILWRNPTNQQQSYTAQSKVILQPMKSTQLKNTEKTHVPPPSVQSQINSTSYCIQSPAHHPMHQVKTNEVWQKVVRKKASKKIVTPKVQQQQPATQAPKKSHIKQQKTASPRPDQRLFLRLEPQHPWRRMSPHFVKLSLAAKLHIASSAITQVTVVN